MNIQKYTEKAQEAIAGAQQLADRGGHPEITPEHLLLTLIEQQGGIVPEILRKMNVDPPAAATAVRTTSARSFAVKVWYSPSDPLGTTPWQPFAASQRTCSAYRS